jgi:hypothetical protein
MVRWLSDKWDNICGATLAALFVTGLFWGAAASSKPSLQTQIHTASEQHPEKKSDEISRPETADDRIARYTLWLAIFTGALVVVSGVQIAFLIRADKTARISANAAKTAADAAIAGQRPWVFLEKVHIQNRNVEGEPMVMNNFFYSVRWKNVGSGPAFPQECLIKIINETDLGDAPDYSDAITADFPATMAVGQEYETRPMGPAPTGKDAIQKVAFGRFTYTDVNGVLHRTGFAHMIAPFGAFALGYTKKPKYEYYD